MAFNRCWMRPIAVIGWEFDLEELDGGRLWAFWFLFIQLKAQHAVDQHTRFNWVAIECRGTLFRHWTRELSHSLIEVSHCARSLRRLFRLSLFLYLHFQHRTFHTQTFFPFACCRKISALFAWKTFSNWLVQSSFEFTRRETRFPFAVPQFRRNKSKKRNRKIEKGR